MGLFWKPANIFSESFVSIAAHQVPHLPSQATLRRYPSLGLWHLYVGKD